MRRWSGDLSADVTGLGLVVCAACGKRVEPKPFVLFGSKAIAVCPNCGSELTDFDGKAVRRAVRDKMMREPNRAKSRHTRPDLRGKAKGGGR